MEYALPYPAVGLGAAALPIYPVSRWERRVAGNEAEVEAPLTCTSNSITNNTNTNNINNTNKIINNVISNSKTYDNINSNINTNSSTSTSTKGIFNNPTYTAKL